MADRTAFRKITGLFQCIGLVLMWSASWSVSAAVSAESKSIVSLANAGTYDEIKAALDAGTDVNAARPGENSPLILAVANNPDLRVSDALLAAGAFPDHQGQDGKTALWYAADREKTPDLAATLLRAGAGVNIATDGGNTPLMAAAAYCCREHSAGRLAIVDLLIKNGANIHARDQDGKTPLMWAAAHGNGPMVRLILDAGAKVNETDNFGWTALHHCVLNPRISGESLATELLSSGAAVNARTSEGDTALLLLHRMEREDHAFVKTLLEAGADPDARRKDGTTLLHIAAASDPGQQWVKTVEHLLDAGASVDLKDIEGKTPLMHVWAQSKKEGTATLLLAGGADVNARDNQGRTALYHVCSRGWRDARGVLPVRWNNFDTGIVEILLLAGADASLAANDGSTPLMQAALLHDFSGVFARLIEAGADLRAKDAYGRSAAGILRGGRATAVRGQMLTMLQHAAPDLFWQEPQPPAAGVKIPGERVVEIIPHETMTLFLKADGTLWCVGKCRDEKEVFARPRMVMKGVKKVSAGQSYHEEGVALAVVKANGRLMVWNRLPSRGGTPAAAEKQLANIKQMVAGGPAGLLVLQSDGDLWSWRRCSSKSKRHDCLFDLSKPSIRMRGVHHIAAMQTDRPQDVCYFALTAEGTLFEWNLDDCRPKQVATGVRSFASRNWGAWREFAMNYVTRKGTFMRGSTLPEHAYGAFSYEGIKRIKPSARAFGVKDAYGDYFRDQDDTLWLSLSVTGAAGKAAGKTYGEEGFDRMNDPVWRTVKVMDGVRLYRDGWVVKKDESMWYLDPLSTLLGESYRHAGPGNDRPTRFDLPRTANDEEGLWE